MFPHRSEEIQLKTAYLSVKRAGENSPALLPNINKKALRRMAERFMLALPIFPVRLQTSIVGRIELNFRVRDGNGWTLDLINTN